MLNGHHQFHATSGDAADESRADRDFDVVARKKSEAKGDGLVGVEFGKKKAMR
jgi:hypothetical protein